MGSTENDAGTVGGGDSACAETADERRCLVGSSRRWLRIRLT